MKRKYFLVVLVLILVMFLAGCSGGGIATPAYEYKVEYKISGTATSVNVTLSNSTGGTEQYSDVILPKVYSYSYFSDNFLYISAQNNGSSGTVNVKCYYKGVLKDSAHSEGAYVIATASWYNSSW